MSLTHKSTLLMHMILLLFENALTAHERARVEQMIQEEERLLMEQSELRVDVIDLTRLAQIKVLSLFDLVIEWLLHYFITVPRWLTCDVSLLS